MLSGDIFDRPNPSTEAQKVYFQFVADLGQTKCKLFMIGGNHDSGKVLECPTPIYDPQKIKVIGELGTIKSKADFARFIIKEDGLSFTLLPYFKNHELSSLRELMTEEEVKDYESLPLTERLRFLFKFLLRELQSLSDQKINIMLAHHLFGYFTPSGSELEIALCGPETFSLSDFSFYDYLALGHIHSPHCVHKTRPRAIYSGAPLVYRFGEEDKKAISLIEVNPAGSELLRQSFVDVPCWRQLRSLSYEELPTLDAVSPLPPLIEVRFKDNEYSSAKLRQLEETLQSPQQILLNVSIEKTQVKSDEVGLEDKFLNAYSLQEVLQDYLNSKDLPNSDFEPLLKEFFDCKQDRRGQNNATALP